MPYIVHVLWEVTGNQTKKEKMGKKIIVEFYECALK